MSQEVPESADTEHVRHFRFTLDGFKSDVCHAQPGQELVMLVPKKWQSSSLYMVYNGTTLSSRSTVQGLHLQAEQVGEVHLRLRMQGGGNICECGERESPVTGQPTQGDSLTSSHESTACEDQPDEMEPHIIANAKATFKALDADGDGE